MKSYEELRDNFYKAVENIDVNSLSLGGYKGNTYKDYAELLLVIASLEEKRLLEEVSSICADLIMGTPKEESEGE